MIFFSLEDKNDYFLNINFINNYCYFIYLMPSTKSRLILFIFLIVVTFIGYMLKGSFESFTFNEENNKIIEDIIVSKEKIDELDPNRLILYLENKLNKNPKDLQGWLILARTCSLLVISKKQIFILKRVLNFFHMMKVYFLNILY